LNWCCWLGADELGIEDNQLFFARQVMQICIIQYNFAYIENTTASWVQLVQGVFFKTAVGWLR
jgi:hypothetical protein